jgi:hypothetical protein
MRLRCLWLSPVTVLTSVYRHCTFASGLPRLPPLNPSRRVRFTNRFTEPALDLRISIFCLVRPRAPDGVATSILEPEIPARGM